MLDQTMNVIFLVLLALMAGMFGAASNDVG